MKRIACAALGFGLVMLAASFADEAVPPKGWFVGEVVEVKDAVLRVKAVECPKECSALRDATIEFHCRLVRKGDRWMADPKEVGLIHTVGTGDRVKVVFFRGEHWRVDGLAVIKPAGGSEKKDPAAAADASPKSWPKEGTLVGRLKEVGTESFDVAVLKASKGAEGMVGQTVTFYVTGTRDDKGRLVPNPEQADFLRSSTVGDTVTVRFRFSERCHVTSVTRIKEKRTGKSGPGCDYGTRVVRDGDGSVHVETGLEVDLGTFVTGLDGATRTGPSGGAPRDGGTATAPGGRSPGTSGPPPKVTSEVPEGAAEAIRNLRDTPTSGSGSSSQGSWSTTGGGSSGSPLYIPGVTTPSR